MGNTSTITRIEAIEDNAGGLHLATFSGDTCTHFFSGFEHGGPDAPSMQEEIEGAAADGVHGWDGDSEAPAADYESMASSPHGHKIIGTWTSADGLTADADAMGNAGHAWARIEWDA